MGRTFEALRQADVPRQAREDQPPVLCPAEEAHAGDEAGGEGAVPFIEVGPRRSVEGSPEVLAGPAPPVAENPDEARVVFRPLPALARPTRAGRSVLAPELVAYHAPQSPQAEQFRGLLAALLPACGPRAGERGLALLFTAARPGTGATTVVLNIAITAACQGRQRVVVADANLRRPALAERLGLPAVPGLREVLAGTAGLDEALRPTDQADLLALTAGLAGPGTGTRFVASTTRSLLRQLRQRADLVLIDGPCWDGRPEAAALAAAADAVFLVLPEKDAESPQADALLRDLPGQGAHLAGCILADGGWRDCAVREAPREESLGKLG
jgi:Mrp family chromosome partitioning ATPase